MRHRARCYLLLIGAALGREACAHAVLEEASPARRSVLTASPAAVRLQFNEDIELRYSSVEVLDGKDAAQAAGTLTAPDAHSLSLPLAPLTAGRYTVHYRVLSADGHVIESRYSFTVKEAAAGQ
jgi:methionine-rich copper-binding protein CopC